MSLESLERQVITDLSYLSFGGADWLQPLSHQEGHVYDVIIVGAGQSGLGAAFGLLRERVSNILVIDENIKGFEGPWDTYARMMTLRTPKHLTSIDFGLPSLTFRSWWEAQYGREGWDALDKIPRQEWMKYLRWYRKLLNLPVVNEVKLKLIEPTNSGVHRLHIEGKGVNSETLLARKVVLATGIQGGGEWHIPPMITQALPNHLYAHASKPINMASLAGKRVGILGAGASAFDNANFVLSNGAQEAHVFARRNEIQRINPIRQMEVSGMIERFSALSDKEKYEVMAHFFRHSQPPTNDTFERACSWPGFHLHLGAPWRSVEVSGSSAIVHTPDGQHTFDFLIISTGLFTDPALRPELNLVEPHILRWGDKYQAPEDIRNPLLDLHPYLSPGFAFSSRDEAGKFFVHGLFCFNYGALVSCGLSASALSGIRFALPKLVSAIADELFLDERKPILHQFFSYKETEFVADLVHQEP